MVLSLSSPLLILASASPRRKELLSAVGLTFKVRPADVDETGLPDENPRAHASGGCPPKRRPSSPADTRRPWPWARTPLS